MKPGNFLFDRMFLGFVNKPVLIVFGYWLDIAQNTKNQDFVQYAENITWKVKLMYVLRKFVLLAGRVIIQQKHHMSVSGALFVGRLSAIVLLEQSCILAKDAQNVEKSLEEIFFINVKDV